MANEPTCPGCGLGLVEGDPVCPRCGLKLTGEEESMGGEMKTEVEESDQSRMINLFDRVDCVEAGCFYCGTRVGPCASASELADALSEEKWEVCRVLDEGIETDGLVCGTCQLEQEIQRLSTQRLKDIEGCAEQIVDYAEHGGRDKNEVVSILNGSF